MNFGLPLLNQDLDSNVWQPSMKEGFFQHEATTPQTCSFDNPLLTPPNTSMPTLHGSVSSISSTSSMSSAGPYLSDAGSVETLSLMTPGTENGFKESPEQSYNSISGSMASTMPLPVQFMMPSQVSQIHQMQQYQPIQQQQPQPIQQHQQPQLQAPTPTTSSSHPLTPTSTSSAPIQHLQTPFSLQNQQYFPSYQYPAPSLLVSPVNEYLHPMFAQTQQHPQQQPQQQYFNPGYFQYQQQFHQQQYQNSLKSATQTLQDQEQLQKEMEMRKANAEELQQVRFVKLTPMTKDRIEQIKELAQEKNILPNVVESVLLLYTPEGRENFFKENRKVKDDMSKLEGNDIYIKIIVNGGGIEDAQQAQQAQQQPNQLNPLPVNDYYYNNINYAANQACRSGSRNRKSKVGHVKRPLNSFMLYRKSQTQSAMSYAVHTQLKLNHQNISQIVGLMWQTESKEVKEQFTYFANREKEIHRVLHPDYKFCPQKKKKRVY